MTEAPGRDRSLGVMIVVALVAVAVVGGYLLTRPRSAPDVALAGSAPTLGADATGADVPDAGPPAPPGPTPAPVTSSIVVEVGGGAVTLSGVVPDEQTVAVLVGAAAVAFGEPAVSDLLAVDPEAEIDDETTVLLSGTVPDVETAQLLVDSFGDLGFGIEDQLVVAPPPAPGSLAALVDDDEDLERFADLLRRAELLSVLEGDEPTTVFAPRDATIEALDEAELDALAQPETLRAIIENHVVAGAFGRDALASGDQDLTTIGGETLSVVVDPEADEPTVGGANLVADDREVDNGVLHVIDDLLLPQLVDTQVRLNEIVAANPIGFAPGSAVLLDDSTAVLDAVVELLTERPEGTVEIQGHTDTDGDDEANLTLSQERADAVLDYLVEQGVPADRLVAVGLGESELEVDPEVTDADKLRNRRIEFRVR